MMITRHLLLILLIVFLSSSAGFTEDSINIIYTGSLEGELEPCGCSPVTNYGGLARIAGYIKDHRDSLAPYILIDAGNFSGKDTAQGKLKTEAVLKAFNLMRYDAVATQARETADDGEFLRSLIRGLNIPVIYDAKGYPKHSLISKGQSKINISIDVNDNLKDHLNILLTDRTLDYAMEIKGWDVIILSSGEILDNPVRENGVIITAGYPKGKKLGILTLKLDNNKILDFSNEWMGLDNETEEDEKVRTVLNEYDMKVAELLKELEQQPVKNTYLGVSKCNECHQLYTDSWTETGHADAIKSLEEAGKDKDPECLFCHTVGFGEPGGFLSLKKTPELANVQCEECHGLAPEHLNDFSKPLQKIGRQVCLKCHTRENSPEFDYETYYEKIKH